MNVIVAMMCQELVLESIIPHVICTVLAPTPLYVEPIIPFLFIERVIKVSLAFNLFFISIDVSGNFIYYLFGFFIEIPKITPTVPLDSISQHEIKIAFLFTLNGRASRQVKRLLKAIYSERHFYYLHVDSVITSVNFAFV